MNAATPPSISRFETAWNVRRQRARLVRTGGFAVLLVCIAAAVWVTEFSLVRLIEGAPRIGGFLSKLIPPMRIESLPSDTESWFWGLSTWAYLLWTTLMIALFGTVTGTVVGAVLGMIATKTYGRGGLAAWLARRSLEFARTVPDLVWALIFVFAFGLGPLAGALAIFVHSAGAQGKLFADVNENVEPGPLEGVRAAGGTWLDEMRLGLLPQVLPNYVSYSLWRLEMNVRSATVIGFVGAGGIGMALYQALSLTYYDDAGAILLMVFLSVVAIDSISERVRLKLSDFEKG